MGSSWKGIRPLGSAQETTAMTGEAMVQLVGKGLCIVAFSYLAAVHLLSFLRCLDRRRERWKLWAWAGYVALTIGFSLSR